MIRVVNHHTLNILNIYHYLFHIFRHRFLNVWFLLSYVIVSSPRASVSMRSSCIQYTLLCIVTHRAKVSHIQAFITQSRRYPFDQKLRNKRALFLLFLGQNLKHLWSKSKKNLDTILYLIVI